MAGSVPDPEPVARPTTTDEDHPNPPYEHGPPKYRNIPWGELPPGVQQMLLRRAARG